MEKEDETPTLVNFCVWLYKLRARIFSEKSLYPGAMTADSAIDCTIAAIHDFLQSEGKTPGQAHAFTDVCRKMAETKEKNRKMEK